MKMYDNIVRTKMGTIACPLTELNLGITLRGGQSFRWHPYDDGYRGVFHGCVWTLVQNETHISYIVRGPLTNTTNYNNILSEYFRLNVSLEDQYKNWAAADEHFQNLLNKTNGVRILKQDVVENIFSFICSSNNNIQRISNMIEKLCLLFGEKICSMEEVEYYNFPTIEALTGHDVEAKLKEEKFGYRAAYIVNAARRLVELGGKQWLLDLSKENNVSYTTAREQLTTLPGIGPKVADCVCLMSLGYLEAIPVDTHIFQIARAHYLPHLEKQKTVTPKIHEEVSNHLRGLWGPLAGWAQAVVFCAKINNTTSTLPTQKRKNSTNEKLSQKRHFRKR